MISPCLLIIGKGEEVWFLEGNRNYVGGDGFLGKMDGRAGGGGGVGG